MMNKRDGLPGNHLQEKSGTWRGGVADYPDHYLLKNRRIEALKMTKGKCQICGFRADVVHHIDGSKDNHAIKNLIPLCDACHRNVHHDDIVSKRKNKTSKLLRKYGMSIDEMSEKIGAPQDCIRYYIHKIENPSIPNKNIRGPYDPELLDRVKALLESTKARG